jgi:hypothetical protein
VRELKPSKLKTQSEKVDVSDIESANLVEIFERIENASPSHDARLRIGHAVVAK